MMHDYPLTLDKFLNHAARWHGDAEVVTGRQDGSIERIGSAMLRTRSLAISALLTGFGVGEGEGMGASGGRDS